MITDKRILRIISLLLVVIMAAAVITACADTKTTAKKGPDTGDDDSDSDSDTDTDEENNYAELPEGLRFDTDGTKTEVRFIVADDTGIGYDLAGRSIEVAAEDKDDNGVNLAVYDRNTLVENALGVDVVLDQVTNLFGLAEKTQDALSSGLDFYRVMGGYQVYAMDLALGSNAGNYLNYYKMDNEDNYINLDKPYWDKKLTSAAAYHNAAYWATGDLCLSYTGGFYVTFVNARIWGNYSEWIQEKTGYSDIYDVVNNKKWTVDFMCDLIDEVWIDTNNNEKVDIEDQSGFISNQGNDVTGFISGFGFNYTKMVDGVPTLDVYKDESWELYQKLHKVYDETKTFNYDYDYTVENYMMYKFAAGNILFDIDRLYSSELYLADMADDYYIIPCPMFDEEQEQYYSTLHDGCTLYMLPYTNNEIAATTATLELLAAESYKSVTPAYYENALKIRYVRGDVGVAAQMIDKIRDSVYFDFVQLYSARVGAASYFAGDFISSKSKTAMSNLSKKSRSLNLQLNRLIEDIDKSLLASRV